jgi:DNA-binding CsgD family transcriptional regulator
MTVSSSRQPGSLTYHVVGRERELDRLDGFVAQIARSGQALLLTGDAGIGKTVLLEEAARRAEARGFTVLRSSGAEFEAGISFAGLHHLLHPLLDSLIDADLTGCGPLRVALGLGDGPQPGLLAVANALLLVLREASRDTPLLLVVDDLPWLDRMSATILGMAARRLRGTRTGLLAAQRSDDRGHFRAGDIPEIAVGPLDPAASDLLLARLHPDMTPRLRGRVAAEAEGNPLALAELPLAAAAASRARPVPLDRRLSGLFAHRIASLPQQTQDLLLLAALDGTGDLQTIATDTTLAALSPAEVSRIVMVDPDRRRLLFRHPLTRHAVIGLSSAEQRRRAHRVLAQRTGDALRRAWHLAEATIEPDEAVAALLVDAARTVLGRGDAIACVTTLTRAAELSTGGTTRGHRLTEAALIAAEATGQLGDATQLLEDARQVSPGTPASLGLAVAASHVMLNSGFDVDAAHRLLVTAIRGDADDRYATETAVAEALHALLMVCWIAGRAEFWEPFHEAVARLAHRAPTALTLCASTFSDPARCPAEVLERLDSAIDSLHQELDPLRIVRTATAAVYVDRVGGCREPLWRVIEDGRQGGAVAAALHAITTLCAESWLAGRWDEAAALADEGIELCRVHGYRRYSWNLGGYVKPLIAAARGQDAQASAAAEEMARTVVPTGAHVGQILADHVNALAALGRGDFEDAYRHAAAISPPGVLASHVPQALWTLLDLVEAAGHTGRHAEAAAHAEAARQAGIASISPRLALLVHACSAVTAGDGEDLALFEQAVTVPDADRWPFDLARVRLLYGERLRRGRATTQARQQLEAAREAFQRLGACPWAQRADAEWQATGTRRIRSTRWNQPTLTPQEREVAELAAIGLANKQIAARLGLSPRTVSTHLYHAFPKLGITSRAALRDALSATGR